MNQNKAIRTAAVVLFVAVALGAIGAHMVEKTLEANGRLETWHTAVLYHLIHGIALLALALSNRWNAFAFWGWMAGILFFSGGLYAYSLTPIKEFGMISAPVGGILFLVGWLGLIISPGKNRD